MVQWSFHTRPFALDQRGRFKIQDQTIDNQLQLNWDYLSELPGFANELFRTCAENQDQPKTWPQPTLTRARAEHQTKPTKTRCEPGLLTWNPADRPSSPRPGPGSQPGPDLNGFHLQGLCQTQKPRPPSGSPCVSDDNWLSTCSGRNTGYYYFP